ncbi:MAG: polar amino acid transporter permease [Hyphomicrobiales bacterium]|nr:polar amino acid transporter permease [Hyphomicrobiales bacterium]
MGRFVDQFINPVIWARYWDEMLGAIGLTVQLTLLVLLTGLLLGLVLGLIRVAVPPLFRIPIVIFADVFRAIPPLVILVVNYFALPFAGIRLSGFDCAWLGLCLVLAAFTEEIIYGGLRAVGKGQWEAARSTGLGSVTTLMLIVFPQALRMTVAPLTNRTIAIAKNTALGSVIAVPEILNIAMSALSNSANSTPLTMAALFYIVLFAPLIVFSRWIEHRFPQRG